MSTKHFFSHYLTPSLSRESRARWADAMGLGELPAVFMELSGQQVLHAERFSGGRREPWLSAPAPADESLPLWRLSYEGAPPVLSPLSTSGLWQKLFPHPYRLLPLVVEPIAETRFEVFPESLLSSWIEAYHAFVRLEKRVAGSEISLWWVRPRAGGEAFPLLLHFVRRKCRRAGTAPHLMSLGELYDRGELGPEALQRHFATQAGFFCLDFRATAHLPALSALVETFTQAAQNPEKAIEYRLSSLLEPDFPL